MAYLLDADVFIEAKNLYYAFDFCPAFWDWLVQQNAAGKVFSIQRVGEEIDALEDELSEWAKQRGAGFFLPSDSAVFGSLLAVSAWVANQSYEASAVSAFLQAADYYLVAQAHAAHHIVVTHEARSASERKITVPDVCRGLGVRCVTPFEMLRNERARFVLRR